MANSDRLQDLRRRAQPPKSAFPGPHGEFTQMGTIHQYRNPTLPYPEEQDDELTADFIYLSFKPGVVDWDSDGLISNSWFLEYKREIKRVEECAVSSGRNRNRNGDFRRLCFNHLYFPSTSTTS